MNKVKRVVLVDDHHLVRAGLRALLDDNCEYEVVGEGADGSEVLELVETHQPDVLLMDIAMKKQSGLDALPSLKKHFPKLPVVLLSMHASRDFVIQAFESGASAYLLKDSAEVELELALQAVMRGDKYVSPMLSDCLVDALTRSVNKISTLQPDRQVLTARQVQILQLIALGKGTKEIAYDLNVSNKTIESHRAQIMERLEIRDIASLVRYAIKQGIISLDDGN